jgi:hypothetical protein
VHKIILINLSANLHEKLKNFKAVFLKKSKEYLLLPQLSRHFGLFDYYNRDSQGCLFRFCRIFRKKKYYRSHFQFFNPFLHYILKNLNIFVSKTIIE